MKVRCPNCQAKFNAPDKYLGKKTRCPKCGEFFILGESQDEPVPSQQTIANAASKRANAFNIPRRFRQYMHADEIVLFAANPSKGALFLTIVLPALFFLMSIPATLLSPQAIISLIFWGFVCLYIFLSWKNRFYIITDKRTFAAEGIFNIAISLIPNKSIQMVCINTGIIDRMLGLNTLEISSAAQGGTNIFYAFAGRSKGSIKLRSISKVNDALSVYHEVFA